MPTDDQDYGANKPGAFWPVTPTNEALLDFALRRWHESVAGCPLVNAHRRTRDDVWREVISFAGGDPELLIGPRHEAMLAEQEAIRASHKAAGSL